MAFLVTLDKPIDSAATFELAFATFKVEIYLLTLFLDKSEIDLVWLRPELAKVSWI